MPTKRQGQTISSVQTASKISDVPRGEVVFYRSSDGLVALDVTVAQDTVWLNQKQMAILFGKNSDTIGLHIRHAFKEGELQERATTEECSVVQREGRHLIADVATGKLDVREAVTHLPEGAEEIELMEEAKEEETLSETDEELEAVGELED